MTSKEYLKENETKIEYQIEECEYYKMVEESFNAGKEVFLKPMMTVIRCIGEDDKEKLHEAVREFAKVLEENDKQELAEYTLAQIGIGAWVVDDGK